MADITSLIMNAVTSSAGGINIPSNLKQQVLGGLSESVLGSLTQTVAKPGGIDLIKSLLTGKANAASSPITGLATNLFTNNILGKLNLGGSLNSSLSGLVPVVMGKLGGILKDQDGDGDVDFNDIILTLKGGSAKNSGSLLGGLLGKVLGR